MQRPGGGRPPYRNFLHALSAIAATEGLAGLYRGLGVTLIGSAPAAVLYFTTYEAVRDALPTAVPALTAAPAATHFAAGVAAEAVSCVLWVPIDVIKERMQVQGRAVGGGGAAGQGGGGMYYRNTADAVRQVRSCSGLVIGGDWLRACLLVVVRPH